MVNSVSSLKLFYSFWTIWFSSKLYKINCFQQFHTYVFLSVIYIYIYIWRYIYIKLIFWLFQGGGKEYQLGTCFFLTNVCIHRSVLLCVECKVKDRNKLTEIWQSTRLASLKNSRPGCCVSKDPEKSYVGRGNHSPHRQMGQKFCPKLTDDEPGCDWPHLGTGKR